MNEIEHSSTTPYSAPGTESKGCSPAQAVTYGISDIQNSRCRLAHNTAPSTFVTRASSAWWLTQQIRSSRLMQS